MIDKNVAIINYLINCPAIKSNPMFFNFINAKDDNKQLVIQTSDKGIERPYIDGSVLKMFTFTIMDYKTITYNPIVKLQGYSNENVDDLSESQSIIDWITAQNKIRNFPNFGSDCIIDEIEALTENPSMSGVDATMNPPLVKYAISIRVTYLDKSDTIFK